MPESEAQKEVRFQGAKIEKSIREDGASPIPGDPKPTDAGEEKSSNDSSDSGSSIFREVPLEKQSEMPEARSNVNMVSGIGQDGLDKMSEKDLLRELVRVVQNLPQEINSLLRQE